MLFEKSERVADVSEHSVDLGAEGVVSIEFKLIMCGLVTLTRRNIPLIQGKHPRIRIKPTSTPTSVLFLLQNGGEGEQSRGYNRR
jgi:hypothetical protein